MERIPICKGSIIAYLENPETGQKTKYLLGHNKIVYVASNLMAQLMRGILPDPAPHPTRQQVDGIRVLAVGTGAIGWNLQSPPAESASQTQLETEVARKEFDSVNYINHSGNATNDITNVLDFTTTFGVGEADAAAIVEMGLFGGENALNAGEGTMINYFTLPVINKVGVMTLIWRLSF